MPEPRLSMRKIKEVLRLRSQGLHQHQIARSCAIGQSTVHHYLKRAAVAGISWPLAEEIDDAELERRLFPSPLAPAERAGLPPLDFVALHRELTRQRRRGKSSRCSWAMGRWRIRWRKRKGAVGGGSRGGRDKGRRREAGHLIADHWHGC